MNAQLKPCPFCGGDVVLRSRLSELLYTLEHILWDTVVPIEQIKAVREVLNTLDAQPAAVPGDVREALQMVLLDCATLADEYLSPYAGETMQAIDTVWNWLDSRPAADEEAGTE